jgi:tetratricopeptide (TPR) repeat protein
LYYGLARLHIDQHDWDAACEAVEQSLQAAPLAESYVLQGRLLQQREDDRGAVAAFDHAVRAPRADPREFDLAEVHRRRAESLLKTDDFKEAKRSLDACISQSAVPTAEVYRLRGLTRAKLGDYSGAISDYTQALSHQPDDSLTLAYRGRVYLVRDALVPAWDDFEKAIELDGKNSDAYSGRAYIRVRRGDAAGAVLDAEEALRRGKETPRLLWDAARIHAQAASVLGAEQRRDRYTERNLAQIQGRAVQLLDQAVTLTPTVERASFWQSYVEPDAAGAFASIRHNPEFLRLARYAQQAE